ncbi:uncharacterized protein [Periplaneta americana]|uniref:uncharacterized protein n=1 Tax=Periplaneta americana TaxID=6978 RepID=UPI0037E9532D
MKTTQVARFVLLALVVVISISGNECLKCFGSCKFVCQESFCGIHDESACAPGEQFVKSRKWYCCGTANCCPACVTNVGLGEQCTASYNAKDGHYKVCPEGSYCNYSTAVCEEQTEE